MNDFFEPPKLSGGVVMRPYQIKQVRAVFSEWERVQSTLLVSATGTGKTSVTCEIAKQSGKRMMFIAHREELINQAAQRLHSFGIKTEIEMADFRVPTWARPQAIVATVQTLCSSDRLRQFDPLEPWIVVVDECHRSPSAQYGRVLDHFKQNSETRILGLTATPERTDKKALGKVFDSVAATYEILDAIEDGYLVPIRQQMVRIEGLDFSKCRTTAGDLNGADLAAVMEEEKTMHGVASATLEIIGSRRALVFTVSVKQAETLADIFNRHRRGMAAWVCGKTNKDDRRNINRQFNNGDIQCLCNVGTHVEGFDSPGVEVIIQARATKSRGWYSQSIGRGTRALPGVVDGLATAEDRKAAIAASDKSHLTVLDFVGNSGRHKLVTTADILGGKASEEVLALAKKRAEAAKGAVDMSDELSKAAKEIEERKKRETARRAGLKATAAFRILNVDPFDVAARPSAGGSNVARLSTAQIESLAKAGIDNVQNLSPAEQRKLHGELIRRRIAGLCSFKQARLLQRHGYDTSKIGFQQASELINALAANGWRRTT